MASNAEKAYAIISTLKQYGVVLTEAKQNALYKSIEFKLSTGASSTSVADYVLSRLVVKTAFNAAYHNLQDAAAIKAKLAGDISTASTTGVDPSVPASPVYSVTADKSAVDEGGVVTFTLSAANVPAGTVLPYVLTGVSSADVAGGSLTGSVVIGSNGKAIIPVLLAADLATEGKETLGISFAGQSASVSVNDTSVAPTPTTMTASASSMTEGATGITYSVTGEAGKTVFWSIDSTHAADVDKNAGSVTLDASGKGSFTIAAVKDGLSEGNEIAVVSLTDTSAKVVATTSTLIVDDKADSQVITLSDGGIKTTTEGQTGITYTVSGGTAGAQYIWAVDQADQVTLAGGQITLDANGSATFTVSAKQDNKSEAPTAVKVSISNINTGAVVATSGFVIFDDPNVAQTYNLTTSVDNIAAAAGNDTFNAVLGGAGATLTPLDNLDGGAGNDVLNIADVAGSTILPAGLAVKGIETLNLAAAGPATINTSAGFTGLTQVNVTTSTGATNMTVGASQAVNVVDTAGTVTLAGGTDQTVTTAGGVALSGATGKITVTDTAQAAVNSTVDNGTSVNYTTTTTGNGSVTIGTVAAKAPTDTVTVVENLKGTGALVGGNITVTGGTVDTITVNASQATAGSTTMVGTIAVNGTTKTTAVTVNQTPAVAPVAAVAAAAGVTESNTVVFGALTAGQTLSLGGLTFTAGAAGTTAAQTAAAFANLANGAITGASVLGVYSGTFTGWASSAITGTSNVTFTSSTANSNVADLAKGGTGAAATTLTKVADGSAAVAAVAGVAGITNGAVNVTDANYAAGTNTITSVTENAYASGAIRSDALARLSLANSAGQTVSVFNNTATTLALTVNKLGAASALNLDAANAAGKYTTLNVTTTTADSTLNVTGAALTTLTVAGTNALNLTGSTLTKLVTATVSGGAGVTLAAPGTLTSFDASAATGNNTVTAFDLSKATFTGGSGVDTLTVATFGTKAVALGAGNDSLVLPAGAAVTAANAAIDGGAGTDVLSMVAADAVAASGSALFASKVTGFEVLALTGATGLQTVDLAALGGFNSVSSSASGGTLTLNNLPSGGTLTITGDTAGTGYVANVTNAATSTTDVLNLVLSKAGALTAGTVTAANVETVNIAANDTTANVAANTNTDTLTLVGTSATSVVVTGNAKLNLTTAGNTKVTLIDASGMTGGLVVTAAGTVAETIKGGAASDDLTAAPGITADVLIGNAGNDKLTANAGLNTLTGGAGNDTFVIGTPSANVNTYSTITDATKGDLIQFKAQGTEVFNGAKIVLGNTAVFQDYANAVVTAGGDASANAKIGWFQFNGDTYVVQSLHDATASLAASGFTNSTDIVVKLTGLVDLSTASFNSAGILSLN